jgi:hypothetical protein
LGVILEVTLWLALLIGELLIVVFFLGTIRGCLMIFLMPAVWIYYTVMMRSIRKAREYRQNTLGKLAKDRRDPVLYLRSFTRDYTENPDRLDRKTYEELLTSVLYDVGPVVAVGDPREAKPILGAHRIYLEDAEWQPSVEYLMSISQLIIIHPDVTPSLLWELEAIKRQHIPEKIIVSFLLWREHKVSFQEALYEKFRKKAEPVLKCSMPKTLEDATFMYFESDWTPRIITINTWEDRWSRKVSLIREPLRPLLHQRGINLN